MATVAEMAAAHAARKSDINEHLPTLAAMARGQRVVELGVRGGASTCAMLAAGPSRMDSYDVRLLPEARLLAEQAAREALPFALHAADDLAVEIPECDLLFIDTLHTETQVFAELSLHAPRTAVRIALHDTQAFGDRGELRGTRGLKFGIDRFMATAEGSRWRVAKVYANNNGLTILERKA